jgi:hypothetical protein
LPSSLTFAQKEEETVVLAEGGEIEAKTLSLFSKLSQETVR